MLETIFTGSADASITFVAAISGILSALLLGALVSLTYWQASKGEAVSRNFILTLIILPAVIAVIILLVGSNVARAFSLAGAFSLVRFRSAPGSPRDIAYILLVMAVGLASGMGFITYAVMFTVILCLVLWAFSLTGRKKQHEYYQLKITVPENLNFEGVFDQALSLYTDEYQLLRIKTADLGSLYRLDYRIQLRQPGTQKKLIDQIRCHNGNLDIALLLAAGEES